MTCHSVDKKVRKEFRGILYFHLFQNDIPTTNSGTFGTAVGKALEGWAGSNTLGSEEENDCVSVGTAICALPIFVMCFNSYHYH